MERRIYYSYTIPYLVVLLCDQQVLFIKFSAVKRKNRVPDSVADSQNI